MGQFFSRAFKRITQGNCNAHSARNQSNREANNQQQQQQRQQQQQHDDQSNRPTTQSIPVGQSIDSDEYASLSAPAADSTKLTGQQDNGASRSGATNQAPISQAENEFTADNQGAVEEAVIKIQALVRGHLTRKALKDAHSQSLPPLNALGQSQFDEESLTRNPPSAVFSATSPLMLSSDFQQQQRMNTSTSAGAERSRTPLESIAEVIETTATAAAANLPTSETGLDRTERLNSGAHRDNDNTHDSKHDDNEPNNGPALSNERRPPLQGNDNKPPEMKARGQSMSPTLSEATASIDLGSVGCETPLTVSIDISDHNIKPNDKFATVLHHRNENESQSKSQQRAALPEIGVQEHNEGEERERALGELEEREEFSGRRAAANLGTPDSLESEEVAAIRIQSAFRGYRSRKNSPYRTRSPNSTNSLPDASERRAILARQAAAADAEGATLAADGDDFSEAADENERVSGALPDETAAAAAERRSGRTRKRDSSETGHDESQPTVGGEFLAKNLANSEGNSANLIPTASQVEEMDGLVSSKEQVRGPPLDSGSASVETVVARLTPEQPLKQTTNSSIDNQDSLASTVALDTLDEPGEVSGAALESWPAQTNDAQPFPNQQREPKSRASLELDTDSSSVIGAALSFNEPDSVLDEREQGDVCSPSGLMNSEYLDDAMIGELDPSSAVDWATNQLAAELEEATSSSGGHSESLSNSAMVAASSALGGQLAELLLNEEEQRAIELESDDIERRDPRGHRTSDDRSSKSPQIKMDELKLADAEEDTAEVVTTTIHDASGGGNLTLDTPEADASGQSFSGFNLSATNSSSNEDMDEDEEEEEVEENNADSSNKFDQKQQQQQQQQQQPLPPHQQQQTTGKAKNKRNKSRNKKKSKK